mgnify:CR=1 FL=1
MRTRKGVSPGTGGWIAGRGWVPRRGLVVVHWGGMRRPSIVLAGEQHPAPTALGGPLFVARPAPWAQRPITLGDLAEPAESFCTEEAQSRYDDDVECSTRDRATVPKHHDHEGGNQKCLSCRRAPLMSRTCYPEHEGYWGATFSTSTSELRWHQQKIPPPQSLHRSSGHSSDQCYLSCPCTRR